MNCAIYIRVSTEGQRDNFSTEIQREKGTKFVLENGWEPIYYDDVESGSSNNRKNFSRLIEDIQEKKIQAVWVIEFTRLSRNDEEESIFLRRLFQEYGIRLFDNGTEITFNSAEDQLFYNFRTAIAAYERRKILERMRNGQRKKYSKGERRYPFSYGYDYLGDKTAINEYEAEIVKEIFWRVSNNETFEEIAKDFTMREILTKKGLTNWTTSHISKMVSYTIYIGLIKDPDGNLIQSSHYEPLIVKELWDRVQNKLKKNRKISIRTKTRRGTYELSGLVTCANCGESYFRKSNYYMRAGERVEKGFYIHSFRTKESHECREILQQNIINESKLIDLIKAIYLEIFEDYDSIRTFFQEEEERFRKAYGDIADRIEVLKTMKEDLEIQKSKLIDLALNGIFSTADIKHKKDLINDQIEELNNEIIKLSTSLNAQKGDFDLIDDFSETEINNFLDMEERDRRNLYLKRITRLHIFNKTLEIEFINNKRYIIPDIYNLEPYWQGRVDMVSSYFTGTLID